MISQSVFSWENVFWMDSKENVLWPVGIKEDNSFALPGNRKKWQTNNCSAF